MREHARPIPITMLILTLCAGLVACDEEVMELPDGPVPLQDAAPGEAVLNDLRPLPDWAPDAPPPDAPPPDAPLPDQALPDLPLPDLPLPDQTVPDTLAPDLYPTPDAPIPPWGCPSPSHPGRPCSRGPKRSPSWAS